MGHSLLDSGVKMCGTRYKLAKRINAAEGTLSKIEAGKAGMPPGIAARIAALVGLDPQLAAVVAVIEHEHDQAKRDALTNVFFPTGVPAELAFYTSARSSASSRSTAAAKAGKFTRYTLTKIREALSSFGRGTRNMMR